MKWYLALAISFLSFAAWACPNCHNTVGPARPPYTLIIVGIFILLTYVPFYILFRAMKKYDPHNEIKLD